MLLTNVEQSRTS